MMLRELPFLTLLVVSIAACTTPWQKQGTSADTAAADWDRCYERANAQYLRDHWAIGKSEAVRETGRIDYERALADRCMEAEGYMVAADAWLRSVQDQDALRPFRVRPAPPMP